MALVCAVLALAGAASLAVATQRALAAARALEQARADFVARAEPALAELSAVLERAGEQVDRVDELVGVAASIGGRVDAATEVTYRALTSPVIKTVALASGTRRAARRLRGTTPTAGTRE